MVRPGFFFIDASRSNYSQHVARRSGALALVLAIAASTACVASPPRQPHRGIEGLWRQFVALPRERALALAGDPDGVWVAGAAGGAATRKEAEQLALEQCHKKRLARRLQVPCLLYATGEKLVWPYPW
jgi:hypothetical protein